MSVLEIPGPLLPSQFSSQILYQKPLPTLFKPCTSREDVAPNLKRRNPSSNPVDYYVIRSASKREPCVRRLWPPCRIRIQKKAKQFPGLRKVDRRNQITLKRGLTGSKKKHRVVRHFGNRWHWEICHSPPSMWRNPHTKTEVACIRLCIPQGTLRSDGIYKANSDFAMASETLHLPRHGWLESRWPCSHPPVIVHIGMSNYSDCGK